MAPLDSSNGSPRKPWQFRLRTLFIVITLAAILVAVPWNSVRFLSISMLFYAVVLGAPLLIRRAIERP